MTVDIAFLSDVKSREAIVLYLFSYYLLILKALLLSKGYPIIFSAKTLRAASVGSPTLLKSPSMKSILAELFIEQPRARDSKALEFLDFSDANESELPFDEILDSTIMGE